MHRAENAYLSYKYHKNKIPKATFFKNKIWHVFHFLTSGYGLKLYRVLLTLLFVVLTFSVINFIFRENFFANGDICTFFDSVYFTFVTLTTLGYGDIAPTTQLGRFVIIIQTVIGISVISLFLSSITSKVVRD
jgi:voltage-gated potassium channel Kch